MSQTYSGSAATPVGFFTSPDAMVWGGTRLFGSLLQPGSDVTPSFLFTVDVTNTVGQFEIDTCCTSPGGHIFFVDQVGAPVLPLDFTKGVITIGTACNAIPFTDVNCDGQTDVFDVLVVVGVAFQNAPDPVPCCVGAP